MFLISCITLNYLKPDLYVYIDNTKKESIYYDSYLFLIFYNL